MLKLKNVTKTYGKNRGINNIDLNIKKGDIFGFIGPNGAGKSTTIRSIMKILNIDEGTIEVMGNDINQNYHLTKSDVGYLPAEIHLYDDLKVSEMFNYSASFYKKDCTKRIKELSNILEVDCNKKIEELSLGNLKKVGIVLSLMHNPKLLILDEPTSGLDPLIQEKFYNILLKEKNKGTTILYSTHILSEIKRICNRVAVIKDGKIIDIKDVKNLFEESIHMVKFESLDDDVKKIFKDYKMNYFNNQYSIVFDDNINKLISLLSKIKLEKLIIDEPSIEEIFMNYYKEENND